MIILVMGVSGSGKTTVGQLLARDLGWAFYDADTFHTQENIERMERGESLTDMHRQPWLDTLRALINEMIEKGCSAVVACSALKAAYRTYLIDGHDEVKLVYLKGDTILIRSRMMQREHFFPATLLQSQFEALEEPTGALTVNIHASPETLVQQIRAKLEI